MPSDEEEDVHHPPDAQSSKCQQLAHPSPREPETEPVEAQEAEENTVEEGGDEVVVGVADAGEAVAEEGAGARALDAVQHAAARRGHGHLLPALAAVAQAAVPQLGEGRLVALVVVRLGALQELLGQEAAGHQRRRDTSLENRYYI